MKKIKQRHRLLLILMTFYLSLTQLNAQNLGCNYKPGDITFNLNGQTQGSEFVSYIVLVDGGNIIRYKSLANQKTILNVGVGSYKAIAITYNLNQVVLPIIEIGNNIIDIGNCLKSTSIPLSVCDCNSSENRIIATIPILGESQQYVLTNGKGVIQQIATTANFQGITDGVYNLYVVCQINGQPVAGLKVGESITNISPSNLCLSTPLSYVVCLPNCKENVCIPYSVIRTKRVVR